MKRSRLTHVLGLLVLLSNPLCLASHSNQHTALLREHLQTPISISVKEMPLIDLLHTMARLGHTHFVLST